MTIRKVAMPGSGCNEPSQDFSFEASFRLGFDSCGGFQAQISVSFCRSQRKTCLPLLLLGFVFSAFQQSFYVTQGLCFLRRYIRRSFSVNFGFIVRNLASLYSHMARDPLYWHSFPSLEPIFCGLAKPFENLLSRSFWCKACVTCNTKIVGADV